MKPDELLLVCGLGRCGTSLAMQMLHVAGVRTAGTGPDYEPEQTSPLAMDLPWLRQQGGSAVKILDPHRNLEILKDLATTHLVRVLWLDRGLHHQARSQYKYASMVAGLPLQGSIDLIDRMVVSLNQETRLCVGALQSLIGPVCRVSFETLIEQPLAGAAQIARFAGIDSDLADHMAGVVRPRSRECQPGFEIELSLMDKGVQT